MKENHTEIILVSLKSYFAYFHWMLVLIIALLSLMTYSQNEGESIASSLRLESMKTFSQGLIKSSSTQLAQ